MKGDRERCLRVGCTSYLSKPVERYRILKELQELVGRAQVLKVLLIEDNPVVATVVAQVLKSAGSHVQKAASGKQSVELVKSFHPHVVFVDLGLPDLAGEELLAALRQAGEGRDMKLVLHTGRSSDEVAGMECDGYLQKPAGAEEILRMVGAFKFTPPG